MGGGGKNFNKKNLQISKNRPTVWKKVFNESKTEYCSPSRSYDQMQIKNVFTAVNSALE